jgi:tetratricopeptide (TPR) repeat protein
MINNKSEAIKHWAYSFYAEGVDHYNQQNYKEAVDKFRLAKEKAANESERHDYQENIDQAEAAALNKEGNDLLDQKKFQEALRKYQAAIDRCPPSKTSTITIIKSNKSEASNRLAYSYYSKGIDLLNQQDFEAAAEKFRQAHEESEDETKKTEYLAKMEQAKARIIKETDQESEEDEQYIEDDEQFNQGLGYQQEYDSENPSCKESFYDGDSQIFEENYYDEKYLYEFYPEDGLKYDEASKFYQKGKEFFSQQKYEEAIQSYEEALNLCPRFFDITISVFEKHMANALNLLGMQLYNDGRLQDAFKKFRQAKLNDKGCNTKSLDNKTFKTDAQQSLNDGNVDSAILQNRIAKVTSPNGSEDLAEINENLANALKIKAKQTMDAAWKAEERNDVQGAKDGFNDATNMFEEAAKISKNNPELQKHSEISRSKVEGDKLFNLGLKTHDQANQSKKKHIFQEARNKYQEAKHHYQQGYEKSGEDNFKKCVDAVQGCIESANNVIRNMTLNAGGTGEGSEEEAEEKQRQFIEIRHPLFFT